MRRNLLLFIILLGISLVPPYLLMDKEYRWAFEPGSKGNIIDVKEFYRFFEKPSKATLPGKLSVGQTYLSGPYIFAGIGAHINKFLARIGILPSFLLTPGDALFIFSFRQMSVLAYAFSVGLSFLCLTNILGKPQLSFFLTIATVFLNPAALNIDMMRVDLYLLFASVLFFYAAFRLIDDPLSKNNYFLFGLAFVLSAATKPNTPFYLNIPGVLFILIYIRRHLNVKNFSILFGTVAVFGSLFFIRWLAHPESILPFISDVVKEGSIWFAIGSHLPYFSYHIDTFFIGASLMSNSEAGWFPFYAELLFKGTFAILTISYLLTIFTSFFLLVYRQRFNFQPKLTFVLIIFIIHSAGLIYGPKYTQYGYLIPFYYLMFIGFALAELRQLNRSKMYLRMRIFWVLIPLIFCSFKYAFKLREVNHLKQAFKTLKLESREWVLNNVKPHSKIAGYEDFYYSPPIEDEDFDFSPQFLSMQGKPDEQISATPPARKQMHLLADVMFLNDFDCVMKPYIIKKLVEAKYDVNQDSLNFNQFTRHLEEISPEIITKLCKNANQKFCKELFITEILSYMWRHDLSFREALEEYFCSAGLSQELIAKLMSLTATELFSQNEEAFDSKYNEYIKLAGGLTPVYAWKQFYDDAPYFFKCAQFESPYRYYFVKWLKIIVINEDCLIASTTYKCENALTDYAR